MKRDRALLMFVFVFSVFSVLQVKAAWGEDWQRVLTGARKEGKAVLGTNQGKPKFRQAVSAAFKKRFGFDVELRSMRGGELTAVAKRECAAGRPSMDVMLSGNSDVIILYPKGCLAPVKSRLLLPEVVNLKLWQQGFLKWTDPEGRYLIQTAEPLYGSILVNSDLIKPGQITLAKDLLRPEYKGKIASYDPRRGGAGQSDATYLLNIFGEEFVRRLFMDQGVVYTANHRQLADWIARGVYSIGLGTVERAVEPIRKEGLPLRIVAFKDAPGYLTGGSSVVKMIKDAPHPNAATVLLNWLLSKEGQQIFTDLVGQPSRRTDVSFKRVPEYRIPQKGGKYLDTYAYEFYAKKRPKIKKDLLKMLGR